MLSTTKVTVRWAAKAAGAVINDAAEARDVASVHLADVRAKIADLKRMERVLKNVVSLCGDGTLPECPLIETLFQKQPLS